MVARQRHVSSALLLLYTKGTQFPPQRQYRNCIETGFGIALCIHLDVYQVDLMGFGIALRIHLDVYQVDLMQRIQV